MYTQLCAVQHGNFWRFNFVVVYCNLLFLLLFGTFGHSLNSLTSGTCMNARFSKEFRDFSLGRCEKSRNFFSLKKVERVSVKKIKEFRMDLFKDLFDAN